MSQCKPVLCVDPGKSGGFAWTFNEAETFCEKMKETEGDCLERMRNLRAAGIERVVIEDQTGVVGPGMKVAASSMFTFGRGFGFLLGAAMALGYRVELVRPMKWQKALALGAKKDHGKGWKRHLKATAQRLYPSCDVTLSTADALLLLEFATANDIAP